MKAYFFYFVCCVRNNFTIFSRPAKQFFHCTFEQPQLMLEASEFIQDLKKKIIKICGTGHPENFVLGWEQGSLQ